MKRLELFAIADEVPRGAARAVSLPEPAPLRLSLTRGPCVHDERAGPGWTLLHVLGGAVRARPSSAAAPDGVFGGGDVFLLGPGASLSLELGPETLMERVVSTAAGSGDVHPGAGSVWSVRWGDIRRSLAARRKVKVSEPALWRPACPPGPWRPGVEIECDGVAFGAFCGGAPETAHVHDRTWELYQPVEGEFEMMARPGGAGPWAPVRLRAGDLGVVGPGVEHLVSEASLHESIVIQIPPAGGDRRVVHFPAESRRRGVPAGSARSG